MRARETEHKSGIVGKSFEIVVIKFTPKIIVKSLYISVKLSVYKMMKFDKIGKHLRFEFKGINPYKLGVIIYQNHVVFIPGVASNRRHPKVTMDDVKRRIRDKI